ncbi:MAG: hypothetical protein ACJ8GN_31590 [Longimicrobiaceae bacterium]
MKKLKLELEDIQVDSFELGKESGRGTIRANCACCGCCPCCCTCCCTCDPSCGDTCYDSCGGTCDVSCFYDDCSANETACGCWGN